VERLGHLIPSVRAPTFGQRTLTLTGLLGLALVAVLAFGILRSARSGANAGPTFTTQCPKILGIEGAQVEWRRTGTPGNVSHRVESVRSPNSSESLEGWRLRYRPAADSPDNPFAADSQVRGADIRKTWFADGLIATAPLNYPVGTMVVSSLTCPGGECLFSPLTGCKATYDQDRAGPKVALTGDSLVLFDDVCGLEAPPAPPDFCGTPLAARLRLRGARVFSQSNPGQGFYSWLPVIREQASTEPDTYILALGTNDALRRQAKAPEAERALRRSETEQAIRQSLREVREVSPKTCIVLVTASGKPIDEATAELEASYAAEAEFVNTLLRSAAAARTLERKIRIAEFDVAARRHCAPSWDAGQPCDWFKPDQLHLRGAGNEARNALILGAVERCQSSAKER